MIRKSFGRGTRGDYGRGKSKDSEGNPFYGLIDRLGFIVKRTRPNGLLSRTFSFEGIGRFDLNDGSKLSVREEYLKEALQYQELYRLKTGIIPSISLLRNIKKGDYIPFSSD